MSCGCSTDEYCDVPLQAHRIFVWRALQKARRSRPCMIAVGGKEPGIAPDPPGIGPKRMLSAIF
jgi:hypothetical protein